MGAALVRVDGVREGMHRFVVGGVPLHRDLHLHRFALDLETDDRRVNRVLGGVEVLDVVDQTARVVEGALERLQRLGDPAAPADRLRGRSDLGQVGQVGSVRRSSRSLMVRPLFRNAISCSRRETVSTLYWVVSKIAAVGPEGDDGAGSRAGAELVERAGLRIGVGLLVRLAVAVDLHLEPGGQRVHHRDADAVQAAGDGVGVGVELAAGMQDRHDDLDGGPLLLRVHLDRDAAAVVVDRDAAVGAQRHGDVVGVAGHRLVDRVVDDFLDQVVQAALAGGADVHAGALADGLQALQHGDRGRAVLVLLCRHRSSRRSCACSRPDTGTRTGCPGDTPGGRRGGIPDGSLHREVPTAAGR